MKSLRFLISFVLTFLANQVLMAVPAPPVTGGPSCWPPPCVPIDSGLVFLMIAGAALGAKGIYDLRKKNKSLS